MRDFIVTEILINNGHRSGVLANMCLGEYKNLEQLQIGSTCITVFKHKRAQAGPICVILGANLFNWLKTYVELMHSAVTTDRSQTKQ